MTPVERRLMEWREAIGVLNRFGAEAQARVLDACLSQLEADLAAADTELLTMKEAAAWSGYSRDHIGRLIKTGRLQNFGKKWAPKVRRSDLPRKALLPRSLTGPHYLGASARQIVRDVITSTQRD